MNVLIVDDEPIVREVLRTMIDWEAHGLRWAGEAGDGEEAWEAVRRGGIDLVVADILMPRTDGLELVRRMHREGCDAAVVVLSCMDDFHYVKEAMKLGVHDYMLKPTMEPDALAQMLLEAKEALTARRREAEERKRREQQWESARQTRLGLDIRRALDERTADSALLKELFGAPGHAVYASVMLWWASDLRFHPAERIWPDAAAAVPCSQRCWLLLFEQQPGGEPGAERVSSRMRSLAEAGEERWFISALGPIADWPALLEAADRHEHERRARFYGSPAERTAPQAAIRRAASPDLSALLREERHNLLRALSGCNREAADHWLGRMRRRLEEARPEPELVWSFARELLELQAVWTRQRDSSYRLDDFEQEYGQAEAAARHLELSRLFEWLSAAAHQLIAIQLGAPAAADIRNPFIRKALDFMHRSYHMPVSTSDIADHVRLSRSYLSDLFSRETGESLTEALTRIRMEAAKRMLRDGSHKVYEIAEAVGFIDARAFAKAFKRHVGCTPKEFVEMSAD